jgi:hypothetical protein
MVWHDHCAGLLGDRKEGVSVKTKMTAAEVEAAFKAIAGDEKGEGVILREIITPDGMRWLNNDPTPMSPETAAAIARKMIEAAPVT